jgi:threonine/homoserine/homoserine lactone efflux protein
VVFVASTALGLTAILASSGAAFHTVRYVGAAYLVYLGLRTLFGRGNVELAAVGDAGAPRAAGAYLQGFAIGLTNPKVALFFLAFFPQFVDPDRAAVSQVFVLGAIFVAIGLVLDLTWAASSGAIGQVLQRRPAFLRKQRFLTGGVYLALGLASAFGGGGRRSSA